MIKTHTTLLSLLPSIRKYGLLCSYSRQERAAVYLHAGNRRAEKWGENHVSLRHNVGPDDAIVHITVNVPRSWIKKHDDKLFYTWHDIPPSMFVRIKVIRRTEELLPV